MERKEEMMRKLQVDNMIRLKGKTFVIVDLGGGTADITFHRIETWIDKFQLVELDELFPPEGGPYGGRLLDQALDSEIMEPLLGKCFEEYQSKCNFGVKVDFFKVWMGQDQKWVYYWFTRFIFWSTSGYSL